MQKNMQCFSEYGVKGVYEEGKYYVDSCDTEFGELRTFLIAELMEDPYCKYEEKMLEFCSYYYGEGGVYVKEIIDELTNYVKDHVNLICRMGDTFSIDEKEAEKIDGLWALAENASKDSEDALAAITRSKLSWRYVKAVLGLSEFSGTLEENRDAREALYNDLIAHGVRMIDEWTWIEEDFSEYELIPVEEWEYASRFFFLVYDMNGGTDGPSNQWAFIDRISDDIPTRNGFRFLGWATEPDAAEAEYLPGDHIDLQSDLILYALWEPSFYVVPCPESAFEEGKDFRLDGSIVSVRHDLPCKLGYYSEGKYVSCQLVYTSDDRHMFEVPSGISEVILVVKGDADLDGSFTNYDVTLAKASCLGRAVVFGEVNSFAADISGDGQFSNYDVTILKAAALNRFPYTWQ